MHFKLSHYQIFQIIVTTIQQITKLSSLHKAVLVQLAVPGSPNLLHSLASPKELQLATNHAQKGDIWALSNLAVRYRFSLLSLSFFNLYKTPQVQKLHIFMVLSHYSYSHKAGVPRFWSWRIFWSWRPKAAASPCHGQGLLSPTPAPCSAKEPVCSQM